MRSRRVVRLVLYCSLSTVCSVFSGCDRVGGDESPDPESPPPHPAMHDTAAKVSMGSSASPSLPPGHPPLGGTGDSASSPPPAKPPSQGEDARAKLARLGLSVTVPEGWIEEDRPGGMIPRLGTFRIPKQDGDPKDGEMSIMGARGSVAANIERWRGQFSENPEAVTSTKEVSGIEITVVELEGTFGAGGPMMKSSQSTPGTKLLGAIVVLPGAPEAIFFKAWGPKKTMEAWKPSFEQFVASFGPAP